jgi:hypothetical protein
MSRLYSPDHDALWLELDGTVITTEDEDGIECALRARTYQAVYPYGHYRLSLDLVPTARGRRTEAYQKIRQELRDDWSTDLTESDPERVAAILERLQAKAGQ